MPKLPVISGKEAVRAFQRNGWVIARQTGSHIILEKEGMRPTLSVPNHKTLDPGTLRTLIRYSGLTVEEFVNLL